MDFSKLHPKIQEELSNMARDMRCNVEDLDESVVLATIEEIEIEIKELKNKELNYMDIE